MWLIDASVVGIAPSCAALGVARATYYPRKRPKPAPAPRRPSPRALSPEERARVLATLHDERYVDLAPATVYARLLDHLAGVVIDPKVVTSNDK